MPKPHPPVACREPAGVGDGLRQDHQPTAIEGENQRLFKGPDNLEHPARPLRVGLHHRLTEREGNAATAEF